MLITSECLRHQQLKVFDVGRDTFILDIIPVNIFHLKFLICAGRRLCKSHFRPFSKKMFSPLWCKYAAFRRMFGISSHNGAKIMLIHESWGSGSRCLGYEVRREKTRQTQYQFYSTPSTEKCCILPVPFYNNTSIIITVAKNEEGGEKNNGR